MDDARTAYQMYKLMKCPEIDAFAAQEKAGSRNVYFERLDRFVKRAPPLLEDLGLSHADGDLKTFQQKIHALRESLADIGAASLSEEAEKVVGWAREEDRKKCGDALFPLSAKVKNLCAKLLDAQGAPDGAEAITI